MNLKQENSLAIGKLKKNYLINYLNPSSRVNDKGKGVVDPKKQMSNLPEEYMHKKKQINYAELSDQLIEELKKPPLKDGAAVRTNRRNAENGSRRKLGKIQVLLKLLPGFSKFMKYYNVDDDAIRTVASLITHRFFPEGSFVFKQGDKSDYFYGIISGRISIREKKRVIKRTLPSLPNLDHHGSVLDYNNTSELSKKELAEPTEKEKLVMNEGNCFGEWGLIYRNDRSASAYCVEDCNLYVLDAGSFDQSFSKCMSKAEYDRKTFLIRSIPYFNSVAKHRFDTLYKTFIAVFHSKGETVHTQGNTADTIYVIYQGSCVVEKRVSDRKSGDRVFKVIYLETGDLSGLEALSYNTFPATSRSTDSGTNYDCSANSNGEVQTKPWPVYGTTLSSTCIDTVIIHIKIAALNELKESFCLSLKGIKTLKDGIIDNLIKKKLESLDSHRLVYRESQLKKHMTNTEGNEFEEQMVKISKNVDFNGVGNINSKSNNKLSRFDTLDKPIVKLNRMKNCTIKIHSEFYRTMRAETKSKKQEIFQLIRQETLRDHSLNSRKGILDNSFYNAMNFNKCLTEQSMDNKSHSSTRMVILQKSPLITSIKTSTLLSQTSLRDPRILNPFFVKANGIVDQNVQATYYTSHNKHLSTCSLTQAVTEKTFLNCIIKSNVMRENIFSSISTVQNEEEEVENRQKVNTGSVCNPPRNEKVKETESPENLLSRKVVVNMKRWDKSLKTKVFKSGKFEMPLVYLTSLGK